MKLSSHETEYAVGDAVEIECSSFGLPVPNVTWQNVVGELTDDDRLNIYQRKEPGKSTLVIQNATLEDASRYRCFATNEINGQTYRHKTYVDITGKTSKNHTNFLSCPDESQTTFFAVR